MGNFKTYFKISSNCYKNTILKFVKYDLPTYISDIFLKFPLTFYCLNWICSRTLTGKKYIKLTLLRGSKTGANLPEK